MECHGEEDVSVRSQVRPADQARRQLRGQELRAVDSASARQRRVHLRQAPRGSGSVGGRYLAVEERRIALHNGDHLGEVQRTKAARPLQCGQLRHDSTEHRVLERALRDDDLRGLRRRLGGRAAQMQAVGVERLGQLLADQLAHALAGDRPGQSRHQPAVGQRVVRALAVQHAVNRCGREPLLHLAVVHQVGLAGAVEVRQPGAVPHHLADGDLRLAVGAELRPVLGDRGFVVDQRAVDEPMNDRGGHALGGGEDHGAGVGGPVRGAAAVGPTRPDIDNGLAVQVDRQRAAAVPGTGKHLAEGPHRTGEVRVGRALEHRVGALRCAPRCQRASQWI